MCFYTKLTLNVTFIGWDIGIFFNTVKQEKENDTCHRFPVFKTMHKAKEKVLLAKKNLGCDEF